MCVRARESRLMCVYRYICGDDTLLCCYCYIIIFSPSTSSIKTLRKGSRLPRTLVVTDSSGGAYIYICIIRYRYRTSCRHGGVVQELIHTRGKSYSCRTARHTRTRRFFFTPAKSYIRTSVLYYYIIIYTTI